MTNIGAALPGTEIATTSYQTSQLSIRYISIQLISIFSKSPDFTNKSAGPTSKISPWI